MKKNELIKKWGKRIDPKAWMFMWYRHYKAIFFVAFLIVLGVGGWSWYYYLYEYQWDDAMKKQYVETLSQETVFKDSKWDDLVGRLEERSRLHTEDPKLSRDIFRGKDVH